MAAVTPVSIDQVIQLAVAPVFLLAGIGAFLNAFAGRLSRIVDRSRVLKECIKNGDPSTCEVSTKELHNLSRRARLVYAGISFSVCSALLVCILILAGFVGHFLDISMGAVVGFLFIGSMLLLIAALLLFLREVFLAIQGLAIS